MVDPFAPDRIAQTRPVRPSGARVEDRVGIVFEDEWRWWEPDIKSQIERERERDLKETIVVATVGRGIDKRG